MTVLGVLVLLVILTIAGLRMWRPKVDLNAHVAAAMRAANGPCLCADPERAGWLHSPVRCVPPSPQCQCGGSLRDASGVVHGVTVCAPLRETVLDGRWGRS